MPGDPVAVTSPPMMSAATIVWRHRRELYVTIVAKMSFALAPGRAARAAPPAPVTYAEVDGGGGRVLPDDLAPCLAAGDVWVVGEVRAAAPGADAALRVSRAGAVLLLDKRARLPARDGRASLGAFGPVSKRWPARARRLGATSAAALEGAVIVVPENIDWAYFHAAPADQQVPWIAPLDEITIEVAGAGVLALRVPAALPRAVVVEAGRAPATLVLRPDTVAIDADAALAHVVYRGRSVLAGDPRAARVELEEPSDPLAGTLQDAEGTGDGASTRAIPDAEVASLRARYALPFRGGSASTPPPADGPRAPMRSSSGETAAIDPSELAALRPSSFPFAQTAKRDAPPFELELERAPSRPPPVPASTPRPPL
ncbi:MAG TPA: DUF2169 domain-containing protein, partial [Byssovorax sp.]